MIKKKFLGPISSPVYLPGTYKLGGIRKKIYALTATGPRHSPVDNGKLNIILEMVTAHWTHPILERSSHARPYYSPTITFDQARKVEVEGGGKVRNRKHTYEEGIEDVPLTTEVFGSLAASASSNYTQSHRGEGQNFKNPGKTLQSRGRTFSCFYLHSHPYM